VLDDCTSPTDITDGTHAFDTSNATQDGTVTCGFNALFDVWYRYTPGVTGTATWSTCNQSSLDTVLARFSACGTQEQCPR
jgi:hypothetical protein